MSEDLTAFLAELRRQEAAEKTIASYSSDLGCFARWFEQSTAEAFALASVTPTDVREYKSYLLNVEKRKPATINRRLAALRKLFGWARSTRRVGEDPTLDVKGSASTPRAPKWLEKREVYRIIRQAERRGNKRNLAIVLLLYHTGLRVGESAKLRLVDIEVSERKGAVIVRSGKGGRYRTVPLNADVRRALVTYLEVRPQVTDDQLFIGQRSVGLSAQGIELIVRGYAEAAGLDGVTPHALRHSFGKHTLDAGENIVTVSRLLGHERLETTAIYTQPSERDLERAVEKLEAPQMSAAPAGFDLLVAVVRMAFGDGCGVVGGEPTGCPVVVPLLSGKGTLAVAARLPGALPHRSG